MTTNFCNVRPNPIFSAKQQIIMAQYIADRENQPAFLGNRRFDPSPSEALRAQCMELYARRISDLFKVADNA